MTCNEELNNIRYLYGLLLLFVLSSCCWSGWRAALRREVRWGDGQGSEKEREHLSTNSRTRWRTTESCLRLTV